MEKLLNKKLKKDTVTKIINTSYGIAAVGLCIFGALCIVQRVGENHG